MFKKFLKSWQYASNKKGFIISLVIGLTLTFLSMLGSLASFLLTPHLKGRYEGILHSFYYEAYQGPQGFSFKAGLTWNPLILIVMIGGVFLIFLLGKYLLRKAGHDDSKRNI